MNYDSERDFTAVAQVAAAPFILVVHPTLPVKTAKELVALARARPGQLNYASASTGGMPHLAGELFNLMAGVKMMHVPYKGAAPATTDLLAGQVQLMFNNMLSALPELPAIAETLPGYEASGWYGLLAPAATPREAVARINAETGRIMKLPEVAQRLAGDGVEAVGTTPDQFAAYLRTEIAKWGRIVKTAGIKAD
jgi:tripartite-type tricarboxylate transporter receptor subunit TctC